MTDWTAAAAAQLDGVVALRRAIHAEPEIGLHTPLTTAKARAALAGLPLDIRESASTTGFVAVLNGSRPSNGRTVLLRGDMDALPMTEETGLSFASTISGAMHACGHDAHTAMLVGAARALSARRDTLAGSVAFMFQPGEEGYHGARHMLADGLLDGDAAPDGAFALHISPNLPIGTVAGRAGPLLASTDVLAATVTGRGGHAAMPHEAADPVPVLCEIVGALQAFIARTVSVFDPAVLTVASVAAGSADNIIPGEARLLGTLRTLSDETRAHCRAGFARVVEHVAAAHGMTGVASVTEGYPVTRCDPRAVALLSEVSAQVGARWSEMPAPMMGGEDFSYVLQRVPGAMAFLGVATGDGDHRHNPPLHNTRMTIDEAALATGVAIHCAAATRFLDGGWGG